MTIEKKLVASFEIFYSRFLNEAGELTQPLPDYLANDKTLWHKLYRQMVLSRVFDTKSINLQRTGQMGTYPPANGQEAINTGVGAAMHADDVFVPYYRECGTHIIRNAAMLELMLYWGGDERGSDYRHSEHDYPNCVPIATQTLHGAGVAAAIKYKKEKRAVLTAIGDGGTSKGDFYEAMNVAGTWQLPLVFLVVNNHWAISVPSTFQTHAKTFAQKAIAAGIPSEQVDGNDIFAVYHAFKKALDRAREGKGPNLIEAITFRMGDHTTADDASRYRPKGELEKGREADPIKRFRIFMEQHNAWDEQQETNLLADVQTEVDAAVEAYLNVPDQPPSAMFDYLYETLPEAYEEQRDEVMAYHGGGA